MADSHKRSPKTLIEAAGGIAVLVGLIFVGLELRQNTEAVQSATLQSMIDSSQEYLLLLASDPELNRIYRQGVADPDGLNEADASQFFFLLRAQWLRFQNAFLQWQKGTMSDEDWVFYENFLCARSASTTGGVRKVTWTDHRPALTKQFVEFVEACWSDGSGSDN